MVELISTSTSVELNRAVNRLLLVVIDYLVDEQVGEVSIVENAIKEVRNLAKGMDVSFRDELLTVLDNYEEHFLHHASVRDKIGWSEELGLTAQMRTVVKSVEPKLISLLDSTLEDRESTLVHLKLASFGVIAIGFILGITMFSLFSKQITRPVQFVTSVVERLSLGDVQQDVEMISGPSEIQRMLRHFQRMIDSLRERSSLAERISEGRLDIAVPQVHEADVLGRALKKMLEQLKGQVSELKSGVNVLGSSTSEITSTVAQVASSSMETATAVTQTMATAEELRQTSELNAQKAKHVSESANQTSTMSAEGQKSTAQILSTMENIRGQMEAIAESVISLSEQSKTIGEIISAVDDLAEQSNILSVNAAIEAARAGEQGRGFAIVAQEIRSLAEQSKDATKRVRVILADIQKATSNTVMATEQGSKAVEKGALQADAVNNSIRSLAEKIATVDQAAIQIMSSSKQQLVGVEQVAAAIQNIRDATTQNAKSMEQLEKAAGSLEEMGHVIVNQINWYKI